MCNFLPRFFGRVRSGEKRNQVASEAGTFCPRLLLTLLAPYQVSAFIKLARCCCSDFVERLPHSAPAHANYSEVFLQNETKIAASVQFKDIEISGPCLKHCLKNSFPKHCNKIDEKVVIALPINIFPQDFANKQIINFLLMEFNFIINSSVFHKSTVLTNK